MGDLPITVYRVGRWFRPWQGEPTDETVSRWPGAVRAFSPRGCRRKAERRYARYADELTVIFPAVRDA